MQTRDNSLDSVGAILIVFMIVGHAFQWSHTQDNEVYLLLRRFLFFFMAFFFYKSGMFWKKRSIKQVLMRGKEKLLYPFLLYMFMGEFVRWVRLFIQEGDTNLIHYIVYPLFSIIGRGGPTGNVPLWFLLALLTTQVVVSLADSMHIKRIILFIITFFIAGICAYVQSSSSPQNIIIPPIISETSLGVVFFLLGAYMKSKQFERKVVVVSVTVYLIAVALIPSYVDFRKGAVSNGYWLAWVVSTIAGIIVFINIFRSPVFNSLKLGYIGRNSMQFFCFHWILFNLVCLIVGWKIQENGRVFGDFFANEPNLTELWGLLISSFVILPVYSYAVLRLKENRTVFAQYL